MGISTTKNLRDIFVCSGKNFSAPECYDFQYCRRLFHHASLSAECEAVCLRLDNEIHFNFSFCFCLRARRELFQIKTSFFFQANALQSCCLFQNLRISQTKLIKKSQKNILLKPLLHMLLATPGLFRLVGQNNFERFG